MNRVACSTNWQRSLWAARTTAYHVAYNALTRAAPRVSAALQRATRDTGRGRGREGAAGADYFEAVMRDYEAIAEASGLGGGALWRGKRVLELGPGDTRATALIAKLEGAAAWRGHDRFDIVSRRRRYLAAIYEPILRRRGAREDAQTLLEGCTVSASLEELARAGPYDLVISRAVLEHVRDLGALVAAVSGIAKRDAVWIHKVDLRDHGMRFDHPLDFLCFPDAVWQAMSSHVDLPNRERMSFHLEVGERAGLRTVWAASTHMIDRERVEQRRHALAPRFRAMSAEELSVLGLWLVQVGPDHPSTRRARAPLPPAPHERLSPF